MKRGAIFVDHTTASAERRARDRGGGRARGVAFLDAPVSGGQAGAENGKLTVMVGGDVGRLRDGRARDSLVRARRALLGPAGSGQLTKMVNQIASRASSRGSPRA